jgi:hypothetical protein
MSQIARRGSHSSDSSISLYEVSLAQTGLNVSNKTYSSIDTSVHSNLMTHLRSIPAITTSWLEESWSPISMRYERIATASPTMGMAVLTREMMEMHIVQTPNVRGMVDCLPVANRHGFIGWRQKLGTWPLSKHEARGGRQFET